jgi:hypothetical protein
MRRTQRYDVVTRYLHDLCEMKFGHCPFGNSGADQVFNTFWLLVLRDVDVIQYTHFNDNCIPYRI